MQHPGRHDAQYWDRVFSHAEIQAEASRWPLHGVDGWSGLRLLGDWEYEDGVLTTVGLGHGDHNRPFPYVNVSITRGDPATLVARLRVMTLVWLTGSFHDVVALRQQPPTSHVQICVGGRPRRFDAWADGEHWFATLPLSGLDDDQPTLMVEARTVSPSWLNLVPLRDLEPYLAGRDAGLRRRRHAS